MKKVYIIIGSILLVGLIGFGTVFAMNKLKAPKLNPDTSDSASKQLSADELYSQAEAAFKDKKYDQAKELYMKAKDEYTKNPSDTSATRITDIDTQLNTIDMQQKYKDLESKNNSKPTLAPSGQ